MISLEELLTGLRSLEVLSEEEVRRLRATGFADGDRETASRLATGLVDEGKLTAYQRSLILQGRWEQVSLGDYLLLDKIGEGGMGQVYLALHRHMRRQVALKLLPERLAASEESKQRFRREIQTLAKLSHPNIVSAYDAREDHGMLYLVMEFVEGETLHDLVKRRGPLSVAEAVGYLLQAARGLQAAHACGIVHRDIKPSNLLCDRHGTVKILDLGLARLVGPPPDLIDNRGPDTLTQPGQIVGTIDYMAPEQGCSGREVDYRADIYSLGCCLHYLLTARPAYQGDTIVDRLLAHRGASIPSLCQARPDVPEYVDAVFRRMVAKRPEDRLASLEKLLEKLGPLEPVRPPARPDLVPPDSRSGVAEPSNEAIAPFVPPLAIPRAVARPRSKRRTWITAGVAVAAVAAIGGLAAVLPRLIGHGQAPSTQAGGTDPALPQAVATPLTEFGGHTNTVECLAFVPGGNEIVSGDDDQRILVWDLKAGKLWFQLARGDDSGPCLAVDPSGTFVATAADTDILKVWDWRSRKEVKRLAGHHVTFSPAGNLVAAALRDAPLALYDTTTWAEVGDLVGHTGWVQAMAFSSDGKTLVSGDEHGFLRVWSVEDRSQRHALENGSRVNCVAVARSRSVAAVVCDDGSLRQWDLADGRLIGTWTAHKGRGLGVAFSPDDTSLASAGADGTIALWDVRSARELTRWPAHPGEAATVAFSSDGNRLASGGDDQTVKIWDLKSLLDGEFRPSPR